VIPSQRFATTMHWLRAFLFPFRRIYVRLLRKPSSAADRLKRIICSGAGAWGIVDVLRRSILISVQYNQWLKQTQLTESEIDELRLLAHHLPYQPLISILMPVYNTDERWLRKAIESVRRQ